MSTRSNGSKCSAIGIGSGRGGEVCLDAGLNEPLPSSRPPICAIGDEKSTAATSLRTSEDWSCALTNVSARNSSVVRRLCAEEESAWRSRIGLKQLESWKNLRVVAWQERMALLQPEERSASLQSFSAVVKDGYDSRSRSPSLIGLSPQKSTCRGRSGLLLENFYEGEVMRAAKRFARREAQERRCHETVELQKMEAEVEALRQRERETHRLLQDVTTRQKKALEDARRATERAKASEAELERMQKAYKAAAASSRDALEGLRLREKQVEMFSADLQRLTTEKEGLQRQYELVRAQQQERIDELERQCDIATQKEILTTKRMQEVSLELTEAQKENQEKEKALREVNFTLQQLRNQTEESERQLCALKDEAEEEHRLTFELSMQHIKTQQMTENLHVELQRCREESTQALKDQAERYEAVLTANKLSAEAAARQLQTDIDEHHRKYEELLQEREAERIAMCTRTEAQQREIKELYDALNGVRQKVEAEAADLATCRQQLQEEMARNDEAERLLRMADEKITKGLITLSETQKERDELRERCDQLEAALRVTKRPLQPTNIPSSVIIKEPRTTPQGRSDANDDISKLRSMFQHEESDTNVNNSSPSPVGIKKQQATFFGLVEGNSMQPVRPQTERHVSFSESSAHIDNGLDTQLRVLDIRVEAAIKTLLDAKEFMMYSFLQQRDQQSQSVTSTLGSRNEDSTEKKRTIASECVIKLRDAMDVLNTVLNNLEFISLRNKSDTGRRESDKKLVEHLQQHRHVLNELLKEIWDMHKLERQCKQSFSIVMYNPFIQTLITSLVKRLLPVIERLRDGESYCNIGLTNGRDNVVSRGVASKDMDISITSPSPRSPQGANTSLLTMMTTFMTNTHTHNKNEDYNNILTRHTFGFTGGRLEISNNGKRLQRLLLPGIVDLMSSSALGSLDHLTFLESQNFISSSPSSSCFEFTIRLGIHCEGLLVGFADRYIQLEGFSTSQSSLRYTNCYYLHIARGTLYCPAQGMIDVPYSKLWNAAAIATTTTTMINTERLSYMDNKNSGHNYSNVVHVGEEISCLLDTVAQTIRFQRNRIDCGVAFEHVCLKRALFPAFEINSRGCTIEFV